MSDRRDTVAPEDWDGPLHERPGLFLRRWQVDGEPVHPEVYLRSMAELARPTEDDPDTEPEPDDVAEGAPVLPDPDPMRVVHDLAELEGQPGVPGRGGPKTILAALSGGTPVNLTHLTDIGWSWQVGLGLGWVHRQQREGGHIGPNGRLTGYKINVHALFRTATCSLRLSHVTGLRGVALWGAVGMSPCVEPLDPNGLDIIVGGWSSVAYLGGWAWTLGEDGRPGDIPTSVPARCFTPRCWTTPNGMQQQAPYRDGGSPCAHVTRPAGWPWTSSHVGPDTTQRPEPRVGVGFDRPGTETRRRTR